MSDTPNDQDAAIVRLSGDEAVILFDLLCRWSEGKEGLTPSRDCFESTAECAVLNNVLCELETQMVAPFKTDYKAVVREARERLAPQWDHPTLSG